MPIRRNLHLACLVEAFNLFWREFESCGRQIVAQLLFVAGSDDDTRDRRLTEQPIEREQGDDYAKGKYENALNGNLPPTTLTLVRQQLQSILRDHGQIKSLRDTHKAA